MKILLMEWWDLSSRFIAYNIYQLSNISKRFEDLCNKQHDYFLCSTINTLKRRVRSDNQTWTVKSFLCTKTLKQSMLLLELIQAQSRLDHHLDVLQDPQFKEILLGGLKAVSQIQWIQIPAEVWQRTESVPGMPALMAEGQALILDAWHVSPPISIKPCLWLAHTALNSRFSKAYADPSAIRLS